MSRELLRIASGPKRAPGRKPPLARLRGGPSKGRSLMNLSTYLYACMCIYIYNYIYITIYLKSLYIYTQTDKDVHSDSSASNSSTVVALGSHIEHSI